ncbi:MAG: hypothetical protein AB1499_13315 [Nitrospirota bacterium]
MIVASGYLEVNEIHNVTKIAGELKRRAIGIYEIEEQRIMFHMKRENIDLVKSEIASLRGMDAVSNVHLTYYSVEQH